MAARHIPERREIIRFEISQVVKEPDASS